MKTHFRLTFTVAVHDTPHDGCSKVMFDCDACSCMTELNTGVNLAVSLWVLILSRKLRPVNPSGRSLATFNCMFPCVGYWTLGWTLDARWLRGPRRVPITVNMHAISVIICLSQRSSVGYSYQEQSAFHRVGNRKRLHAWLMIHTPSSGWAPRTMQSQKCSREDAQAYVDSQKRREEQCAKR